VTSKLVVPATIDTHLTWDYETAYPRIRRLYDEARQLQWDEARDIDWTCPEEVSRPAQSTYGKDAFDKSPLGAYGEDMWLRFRREQQSWMVSQFLHGEQAALVVSARLAEVLPDIALKGYAASQAAEEARHVAVFDRYARQRLQERFHASDSFSCLLEQMLRDSRWDIAALGMQIMVEALALAAFRLANASFDDPLIRQITLLIARDESRHVSFGVLLLRDLYAQANEPELRYREDFVLEAADLLSRRYLMTELWERISVNPADGAEFARSNEMMRAYRCTIFARVVQTLDRVGLMTERVRRGFHQLGVLNTSTRLRTAR
jgi:rubrerythrin